MTGMVARMREAGLITIEAHTDDAQAVRLQLTPLGRPMKPKCRKMAGEMERLVEAGTSFANVVMEHPGGASPANTVYNWDCPAVNCHVLDDARWRLPYFDQAASALIGDVYTRGLDRKVMVIVTGKFGHTPRVTYQKGTGTRVVQLGRDH